MLAKQPIVLPQLRASVPLHRDLAAARSYVCVQWGKERIKAARRDPLQQLLEEVRRIGADVRQLRRGFQLLEEGQTDTSRRLDNVANLPLIGLRRETSKAVDGDLFPFTVVPFNDGSMPTEHRLTDIALIFKNTSLSIALLFLLP
ncbi:hypothetical protein V1517DRAFT_375185 [Lipomyces orientalis]|uniref:Uncharacterized protein n=1 Tax=Lipomyces orientalis TaxID=1233043 RepID=A0ACC3TJ64_9ASCO